MVEVTGPAYKNIDNRLLSLTLVKENMTNAVIFTPDGSKTTIRYSIQKKYFNYAW